MKLVCFANNTGGGLLCDLLNQTRSRFEGYKTSSSEHSMLKITDTPWIEKKFDQESWNQTVNYIVLKDKWFGTHYHPSIIPKLDQFESVIAITTETRQSKLYRWMRYYYGWFKSVHPEFVESDDIESIDKIRCLAKNVFMPFEAHPKCINYEFSKLVDASLIYDLQLDSEYFIQWQQRNPWLYDFNTFNWAVQRFNEAEYELSTNTSFKYI